MTWCIDFDGRVAQMLKWEMNSGGPCAGLARGAFEFGWSDQRALNRLEFQTGPPSIFHIHLKSAQFPIANILAGCYPYPCCSDSVLEIISSVAFLPLSCPCP